MAIPFDLDTEVLALVRQKLIELPTYPGVALRLQRELSNPDWSLATLATLVQADQGLSTYVLRAANSAFYPRATPVTTLGQAISRIGAKGLANIALAGTLGLKGEAPGSLATLRKEAWRASLISSVLCQELAPGRKLDPGEAFLAGLLHGFGETLAYGCFESILLRFPETQPQSPETWQAHGRRHQAELGVAIASEWRLPAFVVEAVQHADGDVSGCEFPELIRLVALSDAVARLVIDGPSVEPAGLQRLPLGEPEQRALLELIPRIPEFLQSFDASASPAPAPAGRPSLVTPVKSQLGAAARAVDFGLTVGKKGAPGVAYQAIEWSPLGLRFQGPQALPERHLVNLDFGPFSVLASVVSCGPSDRGWVLEVKPFAMDRKLSGQWNELGRPAGVEAPAR